MRSTTIFIAGIGLSLAAAASAEAYAFSQPSQPACEMRPSVRDLGPLEGCGGEPGSHPRGVVVTSLATANSSVTPMAAVVVVDYEQVRLDQLPVLSSRSSK
jgi:hypothetical protein